MFDANRLSGRDAPDWPVESGILVLQPDRPDAAPGLSSRNLRKLLQHVTHPVPPSKLEACIEFYRLLGFEPVAVPEGIAGRARWLQRGPGQIHLMPDDQAGPRPGHVGLVVEAYEETVTALRRQGHAVDPRQQHWGSPRAYVHDPAGNLVEIMAFAPSPAADAPAS